MSCNKHQSWRPWIHDKDTSGTDASMQTSAWSANMPSAATAQRGQLHQTKDPVKGGNTSATEQRKTSSTVFPDFRGGEPMAWITHTTPEPARMCLHVFPSVLCYQNSIGLLMHPRRTDLGCYINQISAILERPDAHISTITPEMMLELESEGCWELWEDVWAASLNSGKVGGEQLLTDRHTLVI